MLDFGTGAFILLVVFMIIVAYGVFWVWDHDVKKTALLASKAAFIKIDDNEYKCERLDYRGITNTSPEAYMLTCVGGQIYKN